MINRRGFLVVLATGMLLIPARATVHHWGRLLLARHQEGSVMHGVGEVVVTVT